MFIPSTNSIPVDEEEVMRLGTSSMMSKTFWFPSMSLYLREWQFLGMNEKTESKKRFRGEKTVEFERVKEIHEWRNETKIGMTGISITLFVVYYIAIQVKLSSYFSFGSHLALTIFPVGDPWTNQGCSKNCMVQISRRASWWWDGFFDTSDFGRERERRKGREREREMNGKKDGNKLN